MVQLKSSFIRKLVEWSLALGLVSFQSVVDFVDSLFSIAIPFFFCNLRMYYMHAMRAEVVPFIH